MTSRMLVVVSRSVVRRAKRAVVRNQVSLGFDAFSRSPGDVEVYDAPLRLGLATCVIVLFGFGGWAMLTSLAGAVIAVGKVSVEGQVRQLQHLDGGIVSQILVRDGDRVRKGDVLLRLDATRLKADLAIVENRLHEALARRARLRAERDEAPRPVRPKQLSALSMDSEPVLSAIVSIVAAFQDLPVQLKGDMLVNDKERRGRSEMIGSNSVLVSSNVPSNVGQVGQSNWVAKSDREDIARRGSIQATGLPPADRGRQQSITRIFEAEVRFFEARRATRLAQKERLRKSIAQASAQIAGYREQRKQRRRQRELVERELAGVKKLYDKGLSRVTRLLALERQISEIDAFVAGLESETAAVGQKIGELEVQILEAERDWREKVLADLRAADLEVKEFAERRKSALDQLRRIDLRAPVDGTVTEMAVSTVGGVVRPAEVTLKIVPVHDRLVVEALLDPNQIDRLHEGQPARVRLPSFEAHTTPELSGVLSHISADLVENSDTNVSSYLVRVQISADQLSRLHDKRLVPGMPAEIFIQTGSRSPLSFLLKPLTDQISRALTER